MSSTKTIPLKKFRSSAPSPTAKCQDVPLLPTRLPPPTVPKPSRRLTLNTTDRRPPTEGASASSLETRGAGHLPHRGSGGGGAGAEPLLLQERPEVQVLARSPGHRFPNPTAVEWLAEHQTYRGRGGAPSFFFSPGGKQKEEKAIHLSGVSETLLYFRVASISILNIRFKTLSYSLHPSQPLLRALSSY